MTDSTWIRNYNYKPLYLNADVQQTGNVSIYNNFTSGWAGSGFRLDNNISNTGTSLELDYLTVRGSMRIYELLIQQIRATNGSIFVSSDAKVSAIAGTAPNETLTFDDPSGHSVCPFAPGDIIYTQTYDASSSRTIVKLIVRRVSSVSGATAVLTAAPGAPTDVLSFKVGDAVVRLGNDGTTAGRQGSIYMSSDDSNAPYISIQDGVTSWADWKSYGKTKYLAGNLSSVTSPTFGQLSGYGSWTQNMYAEGNVNISGTLTAGDANGFGNTFYAGRINKNLFSLNSQKVSTWGVSNSSNWNITDNYYFAPDGTVTASTLSAPDTSNWIGIPFDGQDLNGQTITFSFWAQAQYGSNLKVSVFGTTEYVLGFTGALTLSWKRYSFTYTMPTGINSGFFIRSSDTNTFQIWGVQKELGSVATPYQPTDGTLSSDNGYGVWSNKLMVGGTMQNPAFHVDSYSMSMNPIANAGNQTFYIGKLNKNLLTNSEHQNYADGATGALGSWNGDVGAYLMDTSTSAVGSKHSVKIYETTHSTGGSFFVHGSVPLVAGTTYTVSGWAKTDVQGNYGNVFYLGGTYNYTSATGFNLTTTWQRFSFTFTSQATIANNLLSYIYQTGVNFWLDGIQVEISSTATAYQRTDGTLLSSDTYGFHASQGGIGGTSQNPVVGLSNYGLSVIPYTGLTANAVTSSGTYIGNYSVSGYQSVLINSSGITGYTGSGTTTNFSLPTSGIAQIAGWLFDSVKIYSSNLAGGTYDGSVYTTTGTAINSNGAIASKNFRIDSSGNAYFVGNITANAGFIGGSSSGWAITSNSLNNYITGLITSCTISTGGSGYSVNDILTISGGTGGTGGTVKVLTVSSGAVNSIALITQGSGYTTGTHATTGGTGTGCTITVVGILGKGFDLNVGTSQTITTGFNVWNPSSPTLMIGNLFTGQFLDWNYSTANTLTVSGTIQTSPNLGSSYKQGIIISSATSDLKFYNAYNSLVLNVGAGLAVSSYLTGATTIDGIVINGNTTSSAISGIFINSLAYSPGNVMSIAYPDETGSPIATTWVGNMISPATTTAEFNRSGSIIGNYISLTNKATNISSIEGISSNITYASTSGSGKGILISVTNLSNSTGTSTNYGSYIAASTSTGSTGTVYGSYNSSTTYTGSSYGVRSEAYVYTSGNAYGLSSIANTTSGTAYGIYADATITSGTAYAGYFNNGNVLIVNTLLFGSAGDTDLYRSAANTLKTDDSFIVSPSVAVGIVLKQYDNTTWGATGSGINLVDSTSTKSWNIIQGSSNQLLFGYYNGTTISQQGSLSTSGVLTVNSVSCMSAPASGTASGKYLVDAAIVTTYQVYTRTITINGVTFTVYTTS